MQLAVSTAISLEDGAEGRTRTDMILLPRDFESRASTSFATSAYYCSGTYMLTDHLRQSKIDCEESIRKLDAVCKVKKRQI